MAERTYSKKRIYQNYKYGDWAQTYSAWVRIFLKVIVFLVYKIIYHEKLFQIEVFLKKRWIYILVTKFHFMRIQNRCNLSVFCHIEAIPVCSHIRKFDSQ